MEVSSVKKILMSLYNYAIERKSSIYLMLIVKFAKVREEIVYKLRQIKNYLIKPDFEFCGSLKCLQISISTFNSASEPQINGTYLTILCNQLLEKSNKHSKTISNCSRCLSKCKINQPTFLI